MSDLQARYAEHFREHVVPRLANRITAVAAVVQLGYGDFDDLSSGLRRFAWRRGAARLSDENQRHLFIWIQDELCEALDRPIPPLSVEVWNMVVLTWAKYQERAGSSDFGPEIAAEQSDD
jgi:hypothetical protein